MGKGIQAEIQQTKPFASLEDEAVVSLHRTADVINGRFSDMEPPSQESGTSVQWSELMQIDEAGVKWWGFVLPPITASREVKIRNQFSVPSSSSVVADV